MTNDDKQLQWEEIHFVNDKIPNENTDVWLYP